MSSDVANFKKRQEDAKKKQTGEMAPDVDQDGKMINPHNPDFITKVPWYLGSSGPTLKHHQVQKNDHVLSLTEADQLINQKLLLQRQTAQTNKSFKKGACKNCGATTHQEKDCVERPRSSKKAAWKTGLDIAPDDVHLKLEDYGKVSFSAKRDQWQVRGH
jgi:pre-mRNA-processing factor SLU7